jgi:hypothetical protein
VPSDARIRRSARKEITALLVIDPYNKFISAGRKYFSQGGDENDDQRS